MTLGFPAAPQGRGRSALRGARHLQSTSPAWCCPCLIPSFPLPSLLSAPCLAPWGFGEHSWAAWPGMSLVHPLFDPHLGEVSQKGRAPAGQAVCPQQPGNVAELRIAPSCRRSFPCTRGAPGQLSLECSHFDFLPLCCVSITENPRLVWGGGETLKLILPSPPLWMFQYSSSSSLFPFPVVPISSFTNHPPFWGLLGKICAEG